MANSVELNALTIKTFNLCTVVRADWHCRFKFCQSSVDLVIFLTSKITQPFFPFFRGAEISVELWSTYLEIPDKALRIVEISETCSEIYQELLV